MKKTFSKHIYLSLIVVVFLVPVFVFSFSLKDSTFKDTINYVRLEFIAVMVNILTALAFLVFFWGLSKFILNADKPAEIENGKKYMIGGILVLFILISWKAILSLISSELDIGDSKSYPLIPRVQSGPSVRTGTAIQLPDGTFEIIND